MEYGLIGSINLCRIWGIEMFVLGCYESKNYNSSKNMYADHMRKGFSYECEGKLTNIIIEDGTEIR